MAARSGCAVAIVGGALVAVLARVAFTEILSAHAVYTNAGNAVPVTRYSVRVPMVARPVRPRLVPGTLVAVLARVLFTHAPYADAFTERGKSIQVAAASFTDIRILTLFRNVVAATPMTWDPWHTRLFAG